MCLSSSSTKTVPVSPPPPSPLRMAENVEPAVQRTGGGGALTLKRRGRQALRTDLSLRPNGANPLAINQ